MIRLAVFDIDRTLVPPQNGEMAAETIAALKQLQAKGIKTAIASGRLFSFLQPEIIEVGFDYYIMSNGSYVTDSTGNILEQQTIDPEIADALVDEMIRRDYPINIRYAMGQTNGNPNCTIVERMQPIWEKMEFRGKPPKAMLEEYVPKAGERPVACGGFIPAEDLPEFVKQFPQLDFLPVFDGPMCDINPAQVSKASGLKLVCRLSGIDICETIAFGDDCNDLELIAAAGIGVAMGNGIQAVKDAADYVTAPSHELGVVKGLRHFGLIDEKI